MAGPLPSHSKELEEVGSSAGFSLGKLVATVALAAVAGAAIYVAVDAHRSKDGFAAAGNRLKDTLVDGLGKAKDALLSGNGSSVTSSSKAASSTAVTKKTVAAAGIVGSASGQRR